jgi:hypothetical protein
MISLFQSSLSHSTTVIVIHFERARSVDVSMSSCCWLLYSLETPFEFYCTSMESLLY